MSETIGFVGLGMGLPMVANLGENGISSKLGTDGIHLSMSTVSSATAQKLA